MTVDLYVYYRVPETQADTLLPLVRSLQSQLAAECGASPALRKRPQSENGSQTWMEIYTAVDDGFAVLLESAVERAGLMTFIDGARHTEHFVEFSQCA